MVYSSLRLSNRSPLLVWPAGCGAEGYIEVGGFVRENATALGRLVTPQITRGYLRKRKRAPRGGYTSRYFVLDNAVRLQAHQFVERRSHPRLSVTQT
jgi:hypothetical protein